MKKEPDEYRRNPHSVSLINFHFVWCPKRRKPVLIGEVAHRLQAIIFELCIENDWRLVALEIMPDHVHFLVNVDPDWSASKLMKRLKGRASHHLRAEFPHLKKLPTLWTPSYFVGSVGNVSSEIVKKYIENQRNK